MVNEGGESRLPSSSGSYQSDQASDTPSREHAQVLKLKDLQAQIAAYTAAAQGKGIDQSVQGLPQQQTGAGGSRDLTLDALQQVELSGPEVPEFVGDAVAVKPANDSQHPFMGGSTADQPTTVLPIQAQPGQQGLGGQGDTGSGSSQV